MIVQSSAKANPTFKTPLSTWYGQNQELTKNVIRTTPRSNIVSAFSLWNHKQRRMDVKESWMNQSIIARQTLFQSRSISPSSPHLNLSKISFKERITIHSLSIASNCLFNQTTQYQNTRWSTLSNLYCSHVPSLPVLVARLDSLFHPRERLSQVQVQAEPHFPSILRESRQGWMLWKREKLRKPP